MIKGGHVISAWPPHLSERGRAGRLALERTAAKQGVDFRMVAKIIDGKAVAAAEREDCKRRVAQLKQAGGRAPGLAVIMVGDNAASAVYVRNKIRACQDVGIRSEQLFYPATVTQSEICDKI